MYPVLLGEVVLWYICRRAVWCPRARAVRAGFNKATGRRFCDVLLFRWYVVPGHDAIVCGHVRNRIWIG